MKRASANMKKNIIVVTVILIIGGIGILLNKRNIEIEHVPIVEMKGTYAIDYNNIKEVVGDADYVFVGNVISEEGTEYKFPIMVENEDGTEREVTSPYTNYLVQIVENIKGNLTVEHAIPIQKAGGITKDKSEYLVYEGDEIPVIGNSYIFFAYAQPDGTLLVSGPISNVYIDLIMPASEDERSEYQKIITAYENEIVTERERFTSIYESE